MGGEYVQLPAAPLGGIQPCSAVSREQSVLTSKYIDLTYLMYNFCNIKIRFNLIIRSTRAHAQISFYKSFFGHFDA